MMMLERKYHTYVNNFRLFDFSMAKGNNYFVHLYLTRYTREEKVRIKGVLSYKSLRMRPFYESPKKKNTIYKI